MVCHWFFQAPELGIGQPLPSMGSSSVQHNPKYQKTLRTGLYTKERGVDRGLVLAAAEKSSNRLQAHEHVEPERPVLDIEDIEAVFVLKGEI